MKPWERRHLRRDVHAAAAARERRAGPWTRALDEHLWEPPSPCDSGLDLLKYELCEDYCIQEDILGSEDEFGDWDVEGQWSRRMNLNEDAQLTGSWAEVECRCVESSGYVQVADWGTDPPGPEGGQIRGEVWGAGLIMHGACANIVTRSLRAHGLVVRMYDVWRYLLRNGCPDASRIQYGGGVAECWQGRTFVAPRNSVLLACPHLALPNEVLRAGRGGWADGRPPAPPGLPPAATWQQQPHSHLLGLPEDLLDRIVGTAAGSCEQTGLVLLATLGRCCRQLRAYATARLPPPRPDPSQAQCRQLAPFNHWSDLKNARRALERRLPGAPFYAAPNWRGAAAALPAALERCRARSANVQNALRITGLVRHMIEELLQPLTSEEQAALAAEEEERRAAMEAAMAARNAQ